MLRRNVPLALPLGLFLASGLFGILIAYVPKLAAWDFFLYVVAIFLYTLIWWKRASEKFLTILIVLLGSVCAALVAGFLVSALLRPPFSFIQANNLAGILALAVPLNVALAVHWARQHTMRKAIALCVLILFLLFGLIVTDSRGAWLALTMVGVAFALGYFLRRLNRQRAALVLPILVIALFALLLAAILRLNASPAFFERVTGFLSASQNEIPRLVLYQQVWRLIQDYFFTGSGLATFPMVYATYALQMHVFILPHAHNLWLQIWMEQGLPGVVAFAWFVASFYWWIWEKRREWNWLAGGGFAATTAMLVHGLVDAAFWYNDATRVLLFVPFAFTLAGSGAAVSVKQDLKIGTVICAAVLIAVSVFWKQALTRWYANVGSLNQTRTELESYAFPQILVEYVRQERDLSGAERYFRQALKLEPQNVTANQRLAMIELARGEYADALLHAQAASAGDPTNPVTWQLLGDAHLALGHEERAYEYWSRLENAADKLDIEAAIRYQRAGDEVRAERARALAERISQTK